MLYTQTNTALHVNYTLIFKKKKKNPKSVTFHLKIQIRPKANKSEEIIRLE